MSANPLHDARVHRGIGLETIAVTTRLSPRVVKALDEGRFADVPAGLYARAYVRAFASAVDLDPDAAVGVLGDRLPVAAQPFVEKPPERAVLPTPKPAGGTQVIVAMVLDSALLAGLSAFFVGLVAAYCGVTIGALVRVAPLPMAVLCAPVWVLYHVLLGRVCGRTAGTILCGLPDKSLDVWSLLNYPTQFTESSDPSA